MRLPLLPIIPDTNAAHHTPTLRRCPQTCRTMKPLSHPASFTDRSFAHGSNAAMVADAATAARSSRVPKVGIADARRENIMPSAMPLPSCWNTLRNDESLMPSGSPPV